MLQISDFRTDIALALGNIPEPVLENAVMGAAIEFCEKTRSWVEPLDALTIQSGVSEYELSFNDMDMAVIGLTDVFVNGNPCHPENIANIRRTSSDWNTRTTETPRFYFMLSPKVIRFWEGFNDTASGEITMSASVKPNRRSKALPEFLYDDHYDAITEGAKSRLFMMKGRSWYSPNDALESKQSFLLDINETKVRVAKSRTRSSVSLRIRSAA